MFIRPREKNYIQLYTIDNTYMNIVAHNIWDFLHVTGTKEVAIQ